MKRLSSTGSPHSMKVASRLALAACLVALGSGSAFGWNASGTVKTTGGAALQGVIVTVKDSAAIKPDTTDAAGAFALGTTGIRFGATPAGFGLRVEGHDLLVRVPSAGTLELTLVDASGARLWKSSSTALQGESRISLPEGLRAGAAFLRVSHPGGLFHRAVTVDGSGWKVATRLGSARSLAGDPVLVFKKTGYADTTYATTGESQTSIAVAMRAIATPVDTDFVEDHRSECTIPTLPAASSLTNITNFPDPFTKMDGTKITTKAQWKCRVEEIRAQLEKYVMGDKMRDATVKATMTGTKMAIVVTAGTKSVTLNVTVSKPSGTGPFPVIIGYGGGNIGGYSGLAVATISYSPFDVASEGSGRGKGLYYDLYGSNATAGELMAWAWGTSRIIDAIAANPGFGLDARHVAVTGCSRYGKGAVIAGVMDQRIKLTIPQESGSGGVAAWRLIPVNSASQPISSTASEQYWLRSDFPNTFNSAPGKLPYDNHEMIAMVIPNGMLVLDNGIDWLGPANGYGASVAGLEIFKAMGVQDALTYSLMSGSHTHCSQPTQQDHWVKSYVQKYLLGGTGEAGKIEAPSSVSFDKAKYVTWTTPTLQ